MGESSRKPRLHPCELPIPAPNLGEGIPLPNSQFWWRESLPYQFLSNCIWCGDFTKIGEGSTKQNEGFECWNRLAACTGNQTAQRCTREGIVLSLPDCTFAAMSSRTHPKNVPVRPSWPELHRSRPPPAAAAEDRCLEGHAHTTGRLPGLPGQPAVTIFRIEGLVCCTALASARPSRSSALRHGAPLAEVISTRWSPAARMRACTQATCFSPYIPAFFLPCAHQAQESLLRLPTLNMTILPAKQVACDLCGLHGSAMQRLPLGNWRAIVLRKTWRCGKNAHVQIYISICVFLCLHLYYYIWNDIYLQTFQLLAALLTIYTYGYTHNSICVHTSTHLDTCISTMQMPM